MFRAPHLADGPVHRPALPDALAPRTLLLLLLAAVLWTLCPLVAQAEGGADWSIAPAPTDGESGRGDGSLAWVLEPGATVEDAVVVTNNAAASLQLRIGARDAITTSDGHLDLVLDDATSTGIGAWVTLESETLDIPAGQSATVPFTLTVPADATPGDYSGGIATSFDGTGSTVAVTYRLSSRVDVRVPGELQVAHEVSDLQVDMGSTWSLLSPSEVTLRYTLTNTGNSRLYSNESIRTSGPLGLLSRTTSTTLEEVLPGSTVERTVTVPAWAAAWNSIELTSSSSGVDETRGTSVTLEESTFAVSWSWVIVIAAVLVLGIWLGVLRSRRRDRTTEADAATTAASPDQTAPSSEPDAPTVEVGPASADDAPGGTDSEDAATSD